MRPKAGVLLKSSLLLLLQEADTRRRRKPEQPEARRAPLLLLLLGKVGKSDDAVACSCCCSGLGNWVIIGACSNAIFFQASAHRFWDLVVRILCRLVVPVVALEPVHECPECDQAACNALYYICVDEQAKMGCAQYQQ